MTSDWRERARERVGARVDARWAALLAEEEKEQAMREVPNLVLTSNDLLSKYGFNDGDTPGIVLDYCDDQDIPYPADWHDVLRELVTEYLVPALDQSVTVVHVTTIHNPVRAGTVDGIDVIEEWDGEGRCRLSPEQVTVPLADVIKAF
jgi:hypothetical protein